jgi:hypothetical protein
MDEQKEKEIAEKLLPEASENVVISVVLSFLDKSEEDGKPKFVSTFYANNSRYMEIAADQIHLTDRMKIVLGRIIKNESCKTGSCQCKKEA